MPFAETSAMDLRVQFVAACLAGEETMTELCALYGISRKTGYKWLSRYRSEGPSGLEDRSRAPLHPGWSIEDEIAARLTEVRRAHPFWGPRKVLGYLRARDPSITWPAASTVGDLFRREGLSEPRRRRRSRAPVGESPLTPSDEPNRVWCADFKGWFRTQDNTRCDPLTVTDNHSRYLLACEIVAPTGAGVRPVLDRLFREHGLPEVFRTDNGTPFAAPRGVAGLGRLSVELIKLGIKVEWIEPGCPQQNGRHERMHRTLKAETA
ncbi:helix-turn-helix domain-containing protein, partial [Roseospira navarrensis]